MIGIHENGELKALNNGYTLGTSGGGGTAIPTADTNAKFDSDAHMNSTDMTTGADSELEDFFDGLNITGGLLGDYVVEQGTSGIWHYRKWNSGVAECWGKYTRNASLAANSHVSIGGTLPSFFIGEAPIASGSGGGTSQPRAFLTYTNVYGTSGAYGIDCYIRNDGGSACSAQWAFFYAIGKWK